MVAEANEVVINNEAQGLSYCGQPHGMLHATPHMHVNTPLSTNDFISIHTHTLSQLNSEIMSHIQVTFTVEIPVNLLLIDSNTKSSAG